MIKSITKNSKTLEAYATEVFNWDNVTNGSWEPETFAIFDRYLNKEHSYLDLGAWIGPTVLYGAQLAKSVLALEPDPVAYSELTDNLLLNKANNVLPIPFGIGPESGIMDFGARKEYGDSMSSFFAPNDRMKIKVMSLADLANTTTTAAMVQGCNFIKMDIEGGEAVVLPAAKEMLAKLKPTLYLSLHQPWFPDLVAGMAGILDTLSIYKHIYTYAYGHELEIELSEIQHLPDFSSIIATDL